MAPDAHGVVSLHPGPGPADRRGIGERRLGRSSRDLPRAASPSLAGGDRCDARHGGKYRRAGTAHRRETDRARGAGAVGSRSARAGTASRAPSCRRRLAAAAATPARVARSTSNSCGDGERCVCPRGRRGRAAVLQDRWAPDTHRPSPRRRSARRRAWRSLAMPRVLHVIESLGLGGAERLLALTVREMKRSQYESVVCHLSDRAVDWRETIEDEGVPVESLSLRSMYAFRAAVAGIRQLVWRWRIDLVHSHLYFPGLYAQLAAWREGLPIASSMHNLELEPDHLRDNPALTPAKQRALRLASRVAVRLARPTLVAVPGAVRASVIRQLGVAPGTVVTIP